jgi:hypothetical protein
MNTKLQLLVRRAKLKFARVLFLKSFYRTTVFKNMEYKIVNENYKNFIPRADFPFVFKVYPLADKE